MVSKNLKREYVLKDGSRLVVDSGQVTAFRPAQHVKPQARPLIQRLVNVWNAAFGRVDPTKTTEQGASGTSAPSIAQLTNIQQRYDRWQVIAECRKMVDNDPRARRSTKKFAREAVRKGATIAITGESAQDRKARGIADRIQRMANPKLDSWAWMLTVEGDLFIQAIASADGLEDAKRMPAASMERLTDDTDEFIDPAQAFEQIDVVTQSTVATFPLALMCHTKWDAIDGERYGYPEIIAARRRWELLELTEEAQAVRRMSRAAKQTLWNVGSPEKPGTPDEVAAFRADNGKVEGKRDVFDPMNVALDVFGNGLVKGEVLEGDRSVHEVDDIRYAQNVYASAGLPTPPPIYNLDAEAVNRDVVEDLREEWLKETETLTALMEQVVTWLFELALLLEDILPETVQYSVRIPSSTIERPKDVVDRIVTLRQQDPPLISFERAVQILAEFTDCEDPEEEMARIEKEIAEKRAYEEKRDASRLQAKQQTQLSKLSNGKGKASNGRASMPVN